MDLSMPAITVLQMGKPFANGCHRKERCAYMCKVSKAYIVTCG